MSTSPATLRATQAFLLPLTGLRAVSVGIVGNRKHLSGYHLGRDRIFGPTGKGAEDYSVQTRRDRKGLSNAASAMDIGRFKRLREMSKWIVAEARANAPDTRDIREIIYSPDGVKVLRWDRERGIKSKPRTGEADDSHLTHTHISWYRDAENRNKTALFARFFETGLVAGAPGRAAPKPPAAKPAPPAKPAPAARPAPPTGVVVKSFNVPKVPSVCTVPKGVRLFATSDLKKVAFTIDPERDMPFLGEPFKGVALIHRTDEQGNPTGKAFFARKSDLKEVRPAAPVPST